MQFNETARCIPAPISNITVFARYQLRTVVECFWWDLGRKTCNSVDSVNSIIVLWKSSKDTIRGQGQPIPEKNQQKIRLKINIFSRHFVFNFYERVTWFFRGLVGLGLCDVHQFFFHPSILFCPKSKEFGNRLDLNWWGADVYSFRTAEFISHSFKLDNLLRMLSYILRCTYCRIVALRYYCGGIVLLFMLGTLQSRSYVSTSPPGQLWEKRNSFQPHEQKYHGLGM